jgi:hypothetical protein
MILLEKDRYLELIEPLKEVHINNLFALSVVEKHVTGQVYVDKIQKPKTFYVLHPYGMSLLFGDCDNKEFISVFRDYALNVNGIRMNHEWMQAYPASWHVVLKKIFNDHLIKSSDNINKEESGIIELNTRVNFKFNQSKYFEFKKKTSDEGLKIIRTDRRIFKSMTGTVVPSKFWDSVNDFIENGVGFSLFYNNKLASTAYSAFIFNDKLELGIETVDEFRGKGLAHYTCSRLIDYCIDNNYEPIWSCRLENTASYRLAEKLGFEPSAEFPYYRLSK